MVGWVFFIQKTYLIVYLGTFKKFENSKFYFEAELPRLCKIGMSSWWVFLTQDSYITYLFDPKIDLQIILQGCLKGVACNN